MTLEVSLEFSKIVNDSIVEYNYAETIALSRFGNTTIQTFKPGLFELIGYPSKILSSAELWRYHDMMKDDQFENLLQTVNSVSVSEFELIKSTSQLIREFGVKYLGVSGTGKKALLASLNYLRIIENRVGAENLENLKLLEIGPGCGYLGLLAFRKGYRYLALENSQAIYLYQKNLWRSIVDSDYQELSNQCDLASKKLSHIPWWVVADLNVKLPEFDVVICNHALQEMDRQALMFYLQRIRNEWTQRSFGTGLVIAQGLGKKNSKGVFETFQKCGFELIEKSESGNKFESVYCWKLNNLISQKVFAKVSDVTLKKLLVLFLIACRRGKSRSAFYLIKRIIFVKFSNFEGSRLEFPSSVLRSWAINRSIDVDQLRSYFEKVIPNELTAEDKFKRYLKFGREH